MSRWPPPPETVDHNILPWLERLNVIKGIETLQSCSGDHPGAERPAHVWLAGRLSAHMCQRIVDLPLVDTVSVLYGRESTPVTEITFVASEGFAALTLFLEQFPRLHRAKDPA